MIKKDLSIDWVWVKKFLCEKERITPQSAGAIVKSAEDSVKMAQGMAKPAALFVTKKLLSIEANSVTLDGGMKLSGSSLSSYLEGAEEVCLFLVTIGSSIESEASDRMKRSDSLDGYMLDRIGSMAVEALAESLEDYIRKEYEANQKSVSMRLSPGYCDWTVEEQVKFNEILDFSKIGVRLTESCMMIPRKSISGLIAIGPKGLFSKKGSQCGICKLKDCDYRRS